MIAAARYDSVLVPKHLPMRIRVHMARASVVRNDKSGQEISGEETTKRRGTVHNTRRKDDLVIAAPEQEAPGQAVTVQEAPAQGGVAPPAANLPKWQDFRDDILTQGEKKYLQHLLALSGDNLKKSCEISGMSRSRLYELLKKYQMTISA
jgi:DNA-binding NtrC family response regulator